MDADGEITFTELGWAVKSKEAPRRRDMMWVDLDGFIYIYDGEDVGWAQIRPPPTHPCKEINHG